MFKSCGALFVFLFTQNVSAFPEMIRHGYINCNACHVSPAGGGLLTAYGRTISKELLSRPAIWQEKLRELLLKARAKTNGAAKAKDSTPLPKAMTNEEIPNDERMTKSE